MTRNRDNLCRLASRVDARGTRSAATGREGTRRAAAGAGERQRILRDPANGRVDV